MTMKAVAVNLGNTTGDSLVVEELNEEGEVVKVLRAERGRMIDLPLEHGSTKIVRISCETKENSEYVDHPQIIVADAPEV